MMLTLCSVVRQCLKQRAEAINVKAELDLADSGASQQAYQGLCTRLRQAVDHPFHAEPCLRDFVRTEDVKTLIQELSEIKPKVPTYEQVKMRWKGPWSLEYPDTQQQPPSFHSTVLDFSQPLVDILLFNNNTVCLQCYEAENLLRFAVSLNSR
jgi:hypothetical protein